MALNVQNYLKQTSLQKLHEEYGINVTYHESEPLVILNYDQIESKPKDHEIIVECRGLVLELNSWKIAARSFPRFFNAGECIEKQKTFDWSNFSTQEKHDGSLILLYYYNGKWRLNTRGSFGSGIINGSEYTWQSLFLPLIPCPLNTLSSHLTYVLEGCSLFNKVVTHYREPFCSLLTIFNNDTGKESTSAVADAIAKNYNFKRPKTFNFKNQEEIVAWLENHPEPTFEGFVLRDCHNQRIKIKKKSYVDLHHLKNNNNIFMPKNLIPLILRGEIDECLVYFPELESNVAKARKVLDAAYLEAKTAFDTAMPLTNQGEFARMLQRGTKLTSVGFTARKTGRPFDEVWRESSAILVKQLFS